MSGPQHDAPGRKPSDWLAYGTALESMIAWKRRAIALEEALATCADQFDFLAKLGGGDAETVKQQGTGQIHTVRDLMADEAESAASFARAEIAKANGLTPP